MGKGAQRLSEEVDLSAMPAVRAAVDNISQARQARASNSGMTEDVKKLLDKHKDKVPVICERSPYSANLPELTKKKHLLKDSMLVGEVKYMIHKQLLKLMPSQSAEQTIYIFVQGKAPKTSMTLKELYERMRAEDGFLYIKYAAENTLGTCAECPA